MYRELSSYYGQIAPQAAGNGPIGGYLTESSLKLVFQTLDNLLSKKNLEWKDQIFVDLGSGEGYPMFMALLEKKCQHVVGIDIARLPLESSWNAAHQLFSPQVQDKATKVTWCITDLDYLSSLHGPSLVYTFNYAFGTTTLHLLNLIEESNTVEIVIMSKRGLQIALKSILHPGPHEYIVTSLKEVEMCQKWKNLLKQKAQKRILKTKMASQSVPMIWFVREDWTDKKASAPSQWHPDTSLSYSWDLHTDEKVLNRQLDQFEEQYQKERQKDKKEEKQGLLLQKKKTKKRKFTTLHPEVIDLTSDV